MLHDAENSEKDHVQYSDRLRGTVLRELGPLALDSIEADRATLP